MKQNLDPQDIHMTKENKEYISLKEAAEITGYSADYVGQLIRSGKLEGKQVFLNVAWMTTREALQKYAQKDKRGKDSQAQRASAEAFSVAPICMVVEAVS